MFRRARKFWRDCPVPNFVLQYIALKEVYDFWEYSPISSVGLHSGSKEAYALYGIDPVWKSGKSCRIVPFSILYQSRVSERRMRVFWECYVIFSVGLPLGLKKPHAFRGTVLFTLWEMGTHFAGIVPFPMLRFIRVSKSRTHLEWIVPFPMLDCTRVPKGHMNVAGLSHLQCWITLGSQSGRHVAGFPIFNVWDVVCIIAFWEDCPIFIVSLYLGLKEAYVFWGDCPVSNVGKLVRIFGIVQLSTLVSKRCGVRILRVCPISNVGLHSDLKDVYMHLAELSHFQCWESRATLEGIVPFPVLSYIRVSKKRTRSRCPISNIEKHVLILRECFVSYIGKHVCILLDCPTFSVGLHTGLKKAYAFFRFVPFPVQRKVFVRSFIVKRYL